MAIGYKAEKTAAEPCAHLHSMWPNKRETRLPFQALQACARAVLSGEIEELKSLRCSLGVCACGMKARWFRRCKAILTRDTLGGMSARLG